MIAAMFVIGQRMKRYREILVGFAVAFGCAACATAPTPDPDAPPPGPKATAGVVYSGVVFDSGGAEKMAADTAAVGRAFKAAGFKFEVAGVSPKKSDTDPAYLAVSLQSDPEYCLQGVARVKNVTPDPDVHFEVRQRWSSGFVVRISMDDCARELVAKIKTRVTPP